MKDIFFKKSLRKAALSDVWAIFIALSLGPIIHGQARAQSCITCWDAKCPQKQSMMRPCEAPPQAAKPSLGRPSLRPTPAPMPSAPPVRGGPARPSASTSRPPSKKTVAPVVQIKPEAPPAAVNIDLISPIRSPAPDPGRLQSTAQPEVTPARSTLTLQRKVLAGWLGTSSAISLGTAIALTIKGTLTSNDICSGYYCNYDLTPHYALSYAVAGITMIGMILAVTIPTKSGQRKPERSL